MDDKKKAQVKYKKRMQDRLHKVNTSGKPHKDHRKQPQTRKDSTKVNKDSLPPQSYIDAKLRKETKS